MNRRNHSAFGSSRERKVAELLRAEGWVVFRCAASKPCDLVALRPSWAKVRDPDSDVPIPTAFSYLVEVKGTTRSPWVAWGPAERVELAEAARMAGASPLLAWWPPHGPLQWYG